MEYPDIHIFHRKHVLKGSIFHCYVSSPEGRYVFGVQSYLQLPKVFVETGECLDLKRFGRTAAA